MDGNWEHGKKIENDKKNKGNNWMEFNAVNSIRFNQFNFSSFLFSLLAIIYKSKAGDETTKLGWKGSDRSCHWVSGLPNYFLPQFNVHGIIRRSLDIEQKNDLRKAAAIKALRVMKEVVVLDCGHRGTRCGFENDKVHLPQICANRLIVSS